MRSDGELQGKAFSESFKATTSEHSVTLATGGHVGKYMRRNSGGFEVLGKIVPTQVE